MNPLASTTVRYLIFTILGTVLLELAPMLKSHAIDWWTLGSSVAPQLGGILLRLAQPDVKAPAILDKLSLGLLNKTLPKDDGKT